MRIAFLGKGGAGKTTTAAGFIRYLAGRKPFVLAIDADVNAHLATALGIDTPGPDIGRLYDQITDHLKGARVDLGDKPMIMTTPPATLSNFVRANADDELVRRYAVRSGSIALLTVGRYSQSDVGSSCYHSKLSGAINILHHMLDGADDFVVSDNTAGTDAIATSLWFAFDLRVFVVEPTLKSVQVYKDFVSILPEVAERTYVLANKVNDEADRAFLTRHIPADKILGMVPMSAHLRRFEQGDRDALDRFYEEQSLVFDAVFEKLAAQRRDWSAYLERLRETHSRLCREWYDAYYGKKLDEGLDESFTYEAAVAAPVVVRSLAAARNAALPVAATARCRCTCTRCGGRKACCRRARR